MATASWKSIPATLMDDNNAPRKGPPVICIGIYSMGSPICTKMSLSRRQQYQRSRNHNHNHNHNYHNRNHHVRTKQHPPNPQHEPTQSPCKRPRWTTRTTRTTNHRHPNNRERADANSLARPLPYHRCSPASDASKIYNNSARNTVNPSGNRKEVCYPFSLVTRMTPHPTMEAVVRAHFSIKSSKYFKADSIITKTQTQELAIATVSWYPPFKQRFAQASF
mmetsp:Transcript_18586/g.22791  ORF Transcript_18586/g.22791 Transcript_18586/m.22791 type:complete len:221 (+) Transcript_18586:198-860(+)